MLESSIIAGIKRRIKSIPQTQVKKLWSSATSRDIDLLIVTAGRACFYEIKAPGKKPDKWQLARLRYWKRTGADVGWFDSIDACVDAVRVVNLAAMAKDALWESHLKAKRSEYVKPMD